MHENREFRIPRVIEIVLHSKVVCNYITYDIHIKQHKTRRWSCTPFSIYTFENSDSKRRSGENSQHKYLFIWSEFLYIHCLRKYHLIPTFIDQPGIYCVPGGRWVLGSVARCSAKRVPTIATHLGTSDAKWSEFGHKAQNATNSFICVLYDYKQCTHGK